jgi:hypothetical protein
MPDRKTASKDDILLISSTSSSLAYVVVEQVTSEYLWTVVKVVNLNSIWGGYFHPGQKMRLNITPGNLTINIVNGVNFSTRKFPKKDWEK